MTDSKQAAVAVPREQTRPKTAPARPKRLPPYHVVLHDDDDHTYNYVIEMLRKLFGHSLIRAFKMAREVDSTGRVIVHIHPVRVFPDSVDRLGLIDLHTDPTNEPQQHKPC